MGNPAGVRATFESTTMVALGETIPVLIVEPLSVDGGEAPAEAVFLHGYGRAPEDYRDFLGEIAALGFRVVAPFLFANGRLRRGPVHYWSCVRLAHRTLEGLIEEGRLAPDAPVFGHSTGAAVGFTMGRGRFRPRAIVALNPVQPSTGPPVLFMLRSAWMNAKMALGLAGEGRRARRALLESGGRFWVNWLRSPLRHFRLIGGLRAFDYGSLSRWYRGLAPLDVPVAVIYGHGDEFYPSPAGLGPGLQGSFRGPVVIERPEQNSHEWLLFQPELAAELVKPFLRGGSVPEITG